MDKKAMYKLTYGLFVLTAAEDGKDNGCIINTAGQVTSEPNRISIAVNKANYTHDMVLRTGAFHVSVISEEADFELFKRFGFQSGRDTDKFAGFEGSYARSGSGLLYVTKGTNALVGAEVEQTIDLGTHTLFIAGVSELEVLSGAASATYDFYQNNIKPKPQPKPEEGAAGASGGKTVWRCRICGYEYEGEELPADFICPLCKHPASDFEKVVL